MIDRFESLMLHLLTEEPGESGSAIPDPTTQLDTGQRRATEIARALNSAFLITLAGPNHRLFWPADNLLEEIARSGAQYRLARFLQRCRSEIWQEVEERGASSEQFAADLESLARQLETGNLCAGLCSTTGRTRRDRWEAASEVLALIPTSYGYLRCSMTAATLFAAGEDQAALDLLEAATRDLDEALDSLSTR